MVVISNLPPPDVGIRHQQSATSAVINDKVIGKGTLYITESHLSWVNSASGQGFSLEYPHISIHAISRDMQTYPEECLYILLDTEIDLPGEERQRNEGEGAAGGDEADSDDENKEGGVTELRFIPEDKSSIDAMYTAMCDCQVLHPDSQDSFSEDDEGNDGDDDEDEGVEADEGFDDYESHEGVHRPTNGDNDMEVDEGQFEDAPDD